MFDRRKPCANCPFRVGRGSLFRLGRARLRDIGGAPAFQCHASVDTRSDEEGKPRPAPRPQQCAGLMAVLLAEDQPNTIMQVAMRLGALDPDRLSRTGAYASWRDVEAAHLDGREPAPDGGRLNQSKEAAR